MFFGSPGSPDPPRAPRLQGRGPPRKNSRFFLRPPPSHYKPLNLPHGPHALPAADRTVPSRLPVLQLLRIRSAFIRIRTAMHLARRHRCPSAAPDPDRHRGHGRPCQLITPRIRSRILITAPSTALGVLFLFPWFNLGRCANLPPVPPSGNRCPALLPALSLVILPPVFHTIFTQIRIQPGKERARKRYTSGLSSWSKWRDSNPRPFGPEPVSGCSRKKTDEYMYNLCVNV